MMIDLLSNRFEKSRLSVKKAYGSKLIDINDKEYIDYNLGNFTQILGHSHPAVIKAINEQSKIGMNYEEKTDLMYNLAKKILKYANMDQLRFLNTGSEATNLALTLARAYTSKNYVIKFSGHYHGWFGEEIYKFTPEFQYLGIPEDYSKYLISAPWNDIKVVEDLFEKHGDKIGAVICEPVTAHSGVVPPFENFLNKLREITNKNNALLIFDEAITGFRLALGGAQEFFGINADLVTYSKAINGGLPLAVMAGKKEMMCLLDEWKVYQAGTCDANPLCLSVCNAVVDELIKEKVPTKLERIGSNLIKGLNDTFNSLNVDALTQGFGSFFQTFFTKENEIRNHRDAVTKTEVVMLFNFINELFKNRIHIFDGSYNVNPNYTWIGSWQTSIAHSKEDISKTIEAAEKSIKVLKQLK